MRGPLLGWAKDDPLGPPPIHGVVRASVIALDPHTPTRTAPSASARSPYKPRSPGEESTVTTPIHLDSLTIRGLRGLRDIELDKLGRINLIVGQNDTGKTSILEAVFLLTGLGVSRLPVAIQNFRRHAVVNSRDLSLLFHDLDVGNLIEIVAATPRDNRTLAISASHADVAINKGPQLSRGPGNGDGAQTDALSYSSAHDPPPVFRCDASLTPHGSREPTTYSSAVTAADGEIKTIDDPDSTSLRKDIIAASMLTPALPYDPKVISDVSVEKRTDALIECLQAVNSRIRDIVVSGDVAYVDLGLNRMVPLSMCGSGLVRAAQIFSLCLLGQVQILLIDEIGSGLHYSAISPVLAALLNTSEQRDMQIFATTHSLEVLHSMQRTLELDDYRRFQSGTEVYALERDKDGDVRAYRYDYEQFRHSVSHGIEVR